MKKSRIKNLIILGILICSWAVLSAVYVYSKSNITVIQAPLPDNVLKEKTFNEFLKGDKITGEFIADQNYLGQVLIRFYNYERINTDEVDFRIKGKGESNWYYEHVYKTDQFLPNNLFTFGFPIISDSKNKIYSFEIESINGTPEESITLSRDKPLAALSFQYPKGILLKNPSIALEFFKNKIKYTNVTSDLIFSTLIYLNFIILILLLEYLMLVKIFVKFSIKNINSSYLISSALVILVFSAILYYLKKPEISMSISIVSFLILSVGVLYLALRGD